MFAKTSGAIDFDWPDWYTAGLKEFFLSQLPYSLCSVCEGVFRSALFPLQRKRELAAMMRMALLMDVRVVGEIGAEKGGSLYHWCQCLPRVERVLAIEVKGTPYAGQFEAAFPRRDFCFIHGSSYAADTVAVVRDWLGEDRFDCLFLDGDKAHVLDDFAAYRALMRRGGVVLIHDINGEPPQAAFDTLAKTYRTARIIDTSEAIAMWQKAAEQPDSPLTAWEQWQTECPNRSCGVGIVMVE